jgi:hypothetical protein
MVVLGDDAEATVAPVQTLNTSPGAGVSAVIVTTVPLRYDPSPVPLFTVSVYVGRSAYVAVTVTAAAGIVAFVLEAAGLASADVSPVHALNVFPTAGAFATMGLTDNAAKLPPPVPLMTVSVNVAAAV